MRPHGAAGVIEAGEAKDDVLLHEQVEVNLVRSFRPQAEVAAHGNVREIFLGCPVRLRVIDVEHGRMGVTVESADLSNGEVNSWMARNRTQVEVPYQDKRSRGRTGKEDKWSPVAELERSHPGPHRPTP